MSVTAAMLIAFGALVSAVDFLMGRKFAAVDAAAAADMERLNGGQAVNIVALNKTGRVMMILSPLPLLILGYVALSGMVD